ncbi:MAG: hypothetical protein LBP40_00630 [Campylobacteraceae bacterium]|jgi:NAD+--asparagine ADP-ribosyltransferase|nr:hypothetical protein [Campylobacteraceae bacterium]
MDSERKISAVLSDRIERLIAKFGELEIENESFKDEIKTLKAEIFEKDEIIAKLQNDMKAKNLETDELLEKIESVLKI